MPFNTHIQSVGRDSNVSNRWRSQTAAVTINYDRHDVRSDIVRPYGVHNINCTCGVYIIFMYMTYRKEVKIHSIFKTFSNK